MSEQEQSGSKFDPTRYMRQLRGRGGSTDYLDVKWRLVWLRSEHPDAQITTEHVTITQDLAIFRAQVIIPGGGSATGYGSETARDFGDFIEKAETKSLGRALIALGYGTQFAQEFGEDDLSEQAPQRITPRAEAPSRQVASAPATPPTASAPSPGPATLQPRAESIPLDARRGSPAQAKQEPGNGTTPPSRKSAADERREAAASSRQEETEDDHEPAQSITHVGRAAQPQPLVRPVPRPSAAPPNREPDPDFDDDEDIDMANYGWTEFWSWARARGFHDRKALDAVVGRATNGMTPLEIRRQIIANQGDA